MIDLDAHTVQVLSTQRSAWAVCACGWTSESEATPGIARMQWAEHLGELARERRPAPEDASPRVR